MSSTALVEVPPDAPDDRRAVSAWRAQRRADESHRPACMASLVHGDTPFKAPPIRPVQRSALVEQLAVDAGRHARVVRDYAARAAAAQKRVARHMYRGARVAPKVLPLPVAGVTPLIELHSASAHDGPRPAFNLRWGASGGASAAAVEDDVGDARAITPRHVKARYVSNLAAAELSGTLPPDWRPEHSPASPLKVSRVVRSVSVGGHRRGKPDPHDALHRSAANKASRRGLPPVHGFTSLSEAVSAIVASATTEPSPTRAGRGGEPRPLCGGTMTYWDRVNFYNKHVESTNKRR
jgi:hypothetical protein